MGSRKMFAKILAAGMSACVLATQCASAELTADAQARLVTYQKDVCCKPSGVYEIKGCLYAHCVIAFPKTESVLRRKRKLMLAANELLKNWAIDYVKGRRTKPDSQSDGVGLALKVLDDANPQWRYADWQIKAGGQELSGKGSNGDWFVLILPKDDVIRQIPSSFYENLPPQDMIQRCIRKLVPSMVRSNASRFYSMCGILDFDSSVKVEDLPRREFAEVASAVKAYLDSSAEANAIAGQAKAIRTPVVDEKRTDFQDAPIVKKSESVSVVTNVLEKAVAVSNVIERAQTADERTKVGMVCGGKVRETRIEKDEMEFVETKTVTTTTTRRIVRRHSTRSVVAQPRFEELFLRGGDAENAKMPQTEVGRKATAVYFDSITPVEGKRQAVMEALRENPGDVQLWNMAGNFFMQGDDFIGALICFRCAAKIDASDENMLVNLARVYEKLGKGSLSKGMAVMAYGLAKGDWAQKESGRILFGISK